MAWLGLSDGHAVVCIAEDDALSPLGLEALEDALGEPVDPDARIRGAFWLPVERHDIYRFACRDSCGQLELDGAELLRAGTITARRSAPH